MNCNEIHPLLHAYVDSELDLVPSLEVERHLKTCTACVGIKRSLQSLRSTVRHSDLAYRAPAALRSRIRKSIGANSTEKESRSFGPRLWQWLALGAMGFAAMTLLLRPA